MDSYVIILTINSLPNSHSLQASNILSQDTIFFYTRELSWLFLGIFTVTFLFHVHSYNAKSPLAVSSTTTSSHSFWTCFVIIKFVSPLLLNWKNVPACLQHTPMTPKNPIIYSFSCVLSYSPIESLFIYSFLQWWSWTSETMKPGQKKDPGMISPHKLQSERSMVNLYNCTRNLNSRER